MVETVVACSGSGSAPGLRHVWVCLDADGVMLSGGAARLRGVIVMGEAPSAMVSVKRADVLMPSGAGLPSAMTERGSTVQIRLYAGIGGVFSVSSI